MAKDSSGFILVTFKNAAPADIVVPDVWEGYPVATCRLA